MLEVIPTGRALGATIAGVDLSRPLTSPEFGAIHAAWMNHLVLRFRDQRLTDEQLMAFSRNFGALDGNPRPFEKLCSPGAHRAEAAELVLYH